MKHIDAFAGIGGFHLGFEREGIETVAFVEYDAGCRWLLEQRARLIPCWGDVRDVVGVPLSGCVGSWAQSRSVRLTELAGVEPDWVVAENSGHRWKAWVPELRRWLWALGYSSMPVSVRASEVGACHERHRAFVIAHADGEQLRELSRWWRREGRQVADELAQSWDSAPRGLGTDDGLPNWVDRRHALGNAVCPPVAQLIARAINSVPQKGLDHD